MVCSVVYLYTTPHFLFPILCSGETDHQCVGDVQFCIKSVHFHKFQEENANEQFLCRGEQSLIFCSINWQWSALAITIEWWSAWQVFTFQHRITEQGNLHAAHVSLKVIRDGRFQIWTSACVYLLFGNWKVKIFTSKVDSFVWEEWIVLHRRWTNLEDSMWMGYGVLSIVMLIQVEGYDWSLWLHTTLSASAEILFMLLSDKFAKIPTTVFCRGHCSFGNDTREIIILLVCAALFVWMISAGEIPNSARTVRHRWGIRSVGAPVP